jgi:hypothetical protein
VPMKNDDWKQDLYRYRLTPAPPKKDDFQDYIDLYFCRKGREISLVVSALL